METDLETCEMAMSQRHHVGLQSALRDWNGWEYVNRLQCLTKICQPCFLQAITDSLCVLFP